MGNKVYVLIAASIGLLLGFILGGGNTPPETAPEPPLSEIQQKRSDRHPAGTHSSTLLQPSPLQ